MAAKTKTEKPADIVVAKTDDGTVQMTFTIAYDEIKHERAHVEKELAENTEVPGFRKGKAPLDKALAKIPESEVIEHSLQHIIPQLLGRAMTEHKLRLAIYPKFELTKANPNENWEVRATSAEFPEVNLGDYKEKILKGNSDKKLSIDQKQQIVIKALLENV